MLNHRWQSVVALIVVGAAVGATFDAKANVLATTTRTTDVASNTNLPVLLPLSDAGGTSLAFSTTKDKQRVVITYNAECAAVATTASKFLSVSILVDGHPTNPNSGTNFALCTSSTSSAVLFTGAVRQSVYVVPTAGTHSVAVVATGVGTSTWNIDDTSLVVEN